MAYAAEQNGSPAQKAAHVALASADGTTGGNLEGKEQRFGIANSALWATVTTDASNGSVNSAHDSYTGIGGSVPLTNMMTGEVIFGGVGSGLYGMLLMVLLAVFIAGLMVGRTPEYLGKKVEAREVKLVLIGVLAVPLGVLVATALAVATKYGAPSIYNSGPQGFSETPLRLHVADEQQRLRVRRLHRLRAAERPRQRGRVRDHLRRPARRRGDARRPLPAAARGPRGRRARWPPSASPPPAPARSGRTPRRSSFLLVVGDRDRRRAHLLPRPAPRPGRPGPDPQLF